jgi:hypothetical protein
MPDLPPVDLHSLPKIDPGAVRLLWVNDWYDGPLEAVVDHAGERCLLVLHDKRALGGDEHPFRWVLVKLTPDQRAEEQRWHDLFAHHVGDHWCMHPDEPHAPTETPQDPELFYAPFRARPAVNLKDNPVLGWLDEMPKA